MTSHNNAAPEAGADSPLLALAKLGRQALAEVVTPTMDSDIAATAKALGLAYTACYDEFGDGGECDCSDEWHMSPLASRALEILAAAPRADALHMDVMRCIPADWKPHQAREWGKLGPILAEFVDDLREGRYPVAPCEREAHVCSKSGLPMHLWEFGPCPGCQAEAKPHPDAEAQPVAWMIVRVAPGMADDGVRCGPFFSREMADQWVDEHHKLVPLYAHPASNASGREAGHE